MSCHGQELIYPGSGSMRGGLADHYANQPTIEADMGRQQRKYDCLAALHQ
jgi:hypothetical protein